MFENNNFEIDSRSSQKINLQSYTLKTFGTVALGLLVTAVTAFLLQVSDLGLLLLLKVPSLAFILMIAELGVVIAFSTRLFKASLGQTRLMFFIYSILTGITFSFIGYAYDVNTIFLAFALSCLYFGSLVAIGYTTKRNLMRLGPILMVGLICLILFNVVAWLFSIEGTDMIVCSLGLLLFTGITAYDVQKMKVLYAQYEHDQDMLQRLSMYSALELYLDFINIFLYILRLLANRD